MASRSAFTEADVAKMRAVAKAVYENPALLADFDRDPSEAAFNVAGFRTPEGYHLHIADDQNRFVPAEYAGKFGAEDAGTWMREEFRVGYKTYSLVACM